MKSRSVTSRAAGASVSRRGGGGVSVRNGAIRRSLLRICAPLAVSSSVTGLENRLGTVISIRTMGSR